MKLKDTYSLEGRYDQPRQHVQKQRHYSANKGLSSQSYGFSSSHVWMSELDYKRKLSAKALMLLNCGVGEVSWESLGQQGNQPVNPKENQHWIFIVKTAAEAETPILWLPDVKSRLIEKDPDAGKDLRAWWERATEDELIACIVNSTGMS